MPNLKSIIFLLFIDILFYSNVIYRVKNVIQKLLQVYMNVRNESVSVKLQKYNAFFDNLNANLEN
jgi:hypothetical protein